MAEAHLVHQADVESVSTSMCLECQNDGPTFFQVATLSLRRVFGKHARTSSTYQRNISLNHTTSVQVSAVEVRNQPALATSYPSSTSHRKKKALRTCTQNPLNLAGSYLFKWGGPGRTKTSPRQGEKPPLPPEICFFWVFKTQATWLRIDDDTSPVQERLTEKKKRCQNNREISPQHTLRRINALTLQSLKTIPLTVNDSCHGCHRPEADRFGPKFRHPTEEGITRRNSGLQSTGCHLGRYSPVTASHNHRPLGRGGLTLSTAFLSHLSHSSVTDNSTCDVLPIGSSLTSPPDFATPGNSPEDSASSDSVADMHFASSGGRT